MLPLALALGGAGVGALNARDQRKREQAMNEAAAVQTEWSPWSGMGPGKISMNAPSTLGGAAGGALQGAMFGQQFANTGTMTKPEVNQNSWAAMGQLPQSNYSFDHLKFPTK